MSTDEENYKTSQILPLLSPLKGYLTLFGELPELEALHYVPIITHSYFSKSFLQKVHANIDLTYFFLKKKALLRNT